jgi:acyl carrier protein
MECYLIEVEDKFGSYGVTGAMIIKNSKESLILDTFFLSCRVLGRGVENQLLTYMKVLCKRKNVDKIKAHFFPTDRNSSIKQFLISTKWSMQHEESEYEVFYLNTADILEENTVLTERPVVNFDEIETIKSDNASFYYVDHVGVAVENLEEAMDRYEKLGYKLHSPVHDSLQDVHLVMCKRTGYLPIELVAPASINSPVNQYLEDSNNILYHMCIRIKDFETFIKELDKRHIKYDIISSPKEAILFDNNKVGFILIKSVGLIEVVENDTIIQRKVGEKDVLQIYTPDLEKSELFFKVLGYSSIINSKKTTMITMRNQFSADIELILKSIDDVSQKNNEFYGFNLCSYIDDMDELMKCVNQNNIKYDVLDSNKEYEHSRFSNIQLKDLNHTYYSDRKIDNRKDIVKILLANEDNLRHRCYYGPLQYWNGEISKDFISKAESKNINNTEVGLEEKIIELCKYIFNKNEIRVDDNFYKIGCNSLKIIKLMAKIYEQYKVEIPLSNVFKNPTINGILSYLNEKT